MRPYTLQKVIEKRIEITTSEQRKKPLDGSDWYGDGTLSRDEEDTISQTARKFGVIISVKEGAHTRSCYPCGPNFGREKIEPWVTILKYGNLYSVERRYEDDVHNKEHAELLRCKFDFYNENYCGEAIYTRFAKEVKALLCLIFGDNVVKVMNTSFCRPRHESHEIFCFNLANLHYTCGYFTPLSNTVLIFDSQGKIEEKSLKNLYIKSICKFPS